jgi:hypothetical protein
MANCHKFQGPNRVTPIPSGGHTPKAHAYATRLKASKANIFFPKFLFEFLMKNRQAGGSRIRGTVKTPSTFEIKTFWCGKKLLQKRRSSGRQETAVFVLRCVYNVSVWHLLCGFLLGEYHKGEVMV